MLWHTLFTEDTTPRPPAVDAEGAGQGDRGESGENGGGAEMHNVFPNLAGDMEFCKCC